MMSPTEGREDVVGMFKYERRCDNALILEFQIGYYSSDVFGDLVVSYF